MTETRADLLAMLPDELAEYFRSIGEPAFRGKQVFSAYHQRGLTISEMTTLPRALRERLAETVEERMPTVSRKLVSAIDGTAKYLLRLSDGHLIECVLMRYEHGTTLCISSQVGCAMGCRFCASTIGGRVRNLFASELVGQILAVSRDSGERIDGVVMMGIGEPLDNYREVLRFLRLVNHAHGLCIGYRHISLSTCGIVPRIYELAKEGLPITLSISLHASSDERRSAIMPINRRYGIDELLTACVAYFKETGRRISFEYTLIAGENDGEDEAEALAALLRRYFCNREPIHVNLIRVNEVKESGYRRPSREAASRFCQTLCRLGVNATVRRRLGADVNAACGQLRRTAERGELPNV